MEVIDLSGNLKAIRLRIDEATARDGRSVGSVKLVAVSKTFGPAHVEAAYRLGIRDFGENKVQEAKQKLAEIAADESLSAPLRERAAKGPGHGGVRWHMVGHLQSNKAKVAAGMFDVVQSVDSLALAELLNRFALNVGVTIPVLLEVNVSMEPSKHGFAVADLWSVFESIVGLPALNVCGLMTVAPISATPDRARPVFRATRELRDELQRRYPGANLPELSMGMSDDFEVAIEEGATIVRLGRSLFGERVGQTQCGTSLVENGS